MLLPEENPLRFSPLVSVWINSFPSLAQAGNGLLTGSVWGGGVEWRRPKVVEQTLAPAAAAGILSPCLLDFASPFGDHKVSVSEIQPEDSMLIMS